MEENNNFHKNSIPVVTPPKAKIKALLFFLWNAWALFTKCLVMVLCFFYGLYWCSILLSTSNCREARRPTSALYEAEGVTWAQELTAISGSSPLELPEHDEDDDDDDKAETPKGNTALVGEGIVATGKREEASDRCPYE